MCVCVVASPFERDVRVMMMCSFSFVFEKTRYSPVFPFTRDSGAGNLLAPMCVCVYVGKELVTNQSHTHCTCIQVVEGYADQIKELTRAVTRKETEVQQLRRNLKEIQNIQRDLAYR